MSKNTLELRARPRSVRRFNRTALMSIVGAGSVLIFGAAAFALRTPDRSDGGQPKELYNTTMKAMPDGLSGLPISYAEIEQKKVPVLGPPLPGDLGAAMVGRERPQTEETNPFQYKPARSRTSSRSRAADKAAKEADLVEVARSSKLFFIEKTARQNNPQQADYKSTAYPDEVYPTVEEASNWNFTSQSISNPIHETDPNQQARKEAFLGEKVATDIYNPHRLQEPISPYQVMAGTIIPASLITGLNSDLPGQVIAQVTENVYDTPSGQFLLIPQGSKLMGRYDSVIAYGQSRALVSWSRLIMPNGSSITIDNLPAVDLAGYAGLEDKVDYHSWRLFKAAALSSVLGVSAELGRDSDDSDILDALRDGSQRTINQAGQQIVTKQISVQPTLTIRPGWRLKVIVNKDLVLKPFDG